MPEIFADQETSPSEAGLKRPDRISPGKETSLIKQPVGRQVYLVVNMENATARQVGRSNEEAVACVLIHKADYQIQIVTGLEQGLENRVIIHRPVKDSSGNTSKSTSCSFAILM